MPDLIDSITEWLITRAVHDGEFSETVSELATRLLDGGLPITRIAIGRSMLHPIIGMTDTTWDIDSMSISESTTKSRSLQEDFRSGRFWNTPFGDMVRDDVDRQYARLSDPDVAARYEIFQRLAADGVTGYACFRKYFGGKSFIEQDATVVAQGAFISFCTRRLSGFSEADLQSLARLILPLCACVRVATDRLLVTRLLETYLGRVSGKHVLTGQSARGDGRTIGCALFYSDMRNSLALSQSLGAKPFLEAVNQYFDCTAGAVLDHGGEVLKFIGDGVLAIFPIDPPQRPPANMCAAALSAARDAFARADQMNAARTKDGVPPIDFGIALHVGDVIYGNVGTEKRLDFTATGPAVGLVSRCEGLTRNLDAALVATGDFSALCPEQGRSLGAHALRGFSGDVRICGYGTRSS